MSKWVAKDVRLYPAVPYRDGFREIVLKDDHNKALAEKDREITHLQDVYTKQRHKREDDYQQLMEKAVMFAENVRDGRWREHEWKDANIFLQSPEVQAWKERQK